MTIFETITFLQNHEIECDQSTVERWISEGKLKATKVDSGSYEVKVTEAVDFLVDLSKAGTAYEKGIDDKVKIDRLMIQIQTLEKEIDELRQENVHLEFKLGISPFN